MRRFAALLTALLVAGAASAAPPSEASIDDLLAATRVERLLDSMLVNVEQTMRESMTRAAGPQPPSAEQRRVIDAGIAKFIAVMREEMSLARMRPLYAEIYRDTFTQEEMDGLLAFYRSPIGAAFIEKMPVVLQKSQSVVQTRLGPLMEKMKSAMNQTMEEARAVR